MSFNLNDAEIRHRLQQLRNSTKLLERARIRINSLLSTIKTLKSQHQSEITKLSSQITELQSKVDEKEAQRKTLSELMFKASNKRDLDARLAKPRGKKPGAVAFHRPKPSPETVTEEIVFSIKKCPNCLHAVGDEVDRVDKYQEDIDLAPRLNVKHHIITRHWCPSCRTYVKQKDIPELERIGINVMAYILYARYRLRLPILRIKESLSDLHDFTISEGEIVGQINKAKTLFGKDHDNICELIKTAKVVYADETGWRMDGDNWYLWAFVAPKDNVTRYELAETRGGRVARDVLGKNKDRVIVSDGYAVYASLPGLNQQCWVHLLRVSKIASQSLYELLCSLFEELCTELTKSINERSPPHFQAELDSLIAMDFPETTARKIQNRIKKHQSLLLTCLDYEGVLPENNTAERAIRAQVILRKIFGGSRTVKGAEAHAVNASVLTTLQKQNPDKSFFDVIIPLLQKRNEEQKYSRQK